MITLGVLEFMQGSSRVEVEAMKTGLKRCSCKTTQDK